MVPEWRGDVPTLALLNRMVAEELPLGMRAGLVEPFFQRDVYFDATDWTLRRRGVTCRFRVRVDDRRLLTVRAIGPAEGGGLLIAPRTFEAEVPELEGEQALAGTSEPARRLRALIEPGWLRPRIQFETERRLRRTRPGWFARAQYELAYDVVTVRGQQRAQTFQELKIRQLRRGRPALEEVARAFAERYGLRPLLVGKMDRAEKLLRDLESAALAQATHGSREVALIVLQDQCVALLSDAAALTLPVAGGSGEDACRALLRAHFGSADGQVRFLGTAPAGGTRPVLEVWLTRRAPGAPGGEGGGEHEPGATPVAPVHRDPRGRGRARPARSADPRGADGRRPLRSAARMDARAAARVCAARHAADRRPPDAPLRRHAPHPAPRRRPTGPRALPEQRPERARVQRARAGAGRGSARTIARPAALPLDLQCQPGRVLHGAPRRAQARRGRRYHGNGRGRALAGGAARRNRHPGPRAARPADPVLQRGLRPGARRARRPDPPLGRPVRATARAAPAVLPRADLSHHHAPGHHARAGPSVPARPEPAALARGRGARPAHGRDALRVSEGAPPGRPAAIRGPAGGGGGGGGGFIPAEDVIRENLSVLYPGRQVQGVHAFRVTRAADLELDEHQAVSLLQVIGEEAKRRPYGATVRLEVERAMPPAIRDLVLRELQFEDAAPGSPLASGDVYEIDGPLDLGALRELARLPLPALDYPPHHGGDPIAADRSVFAVLAERDLLVHHPHDAFETTVERLFVEAADDPDVVAIKLTLYRAGGRSGIVEALLRAAERGKEVFVFVELKARFDEERNIAWARKLEQGGIRVVYGLVELKTHAKTALIVRREAGGVRRYVHIGTGNYNAATAALYTDLGLLSADPELGADVNDLFNELSGSSQAPSTAFRRLLVAPTSLLPRLIELIDREAEHARGGRGGLIRAKLNGLADPDVIAALYRASEAGADVELVVRGVCTLRPGAVGLSERIRVVSILGRFLEHARIYSFANAGDPEYFIGSADWRPRNLRRRVEVVAPVRDPACRRRLDEILDAELADPHGWDLLADGSYARREAGVSDRSVAAAS